MLIEQAGQSGTLTKTDLKNVLGKMTSILQFNAAQTTEQGNKLVAWHAAFADRQDMAEAAISKHTQQIANVTAQVDAITSNNVKEQATRPIL